MRFLQKRSSVFAVALLVPLALPTLRADEWTKRTVVTVNETIQVPNQVLPSGTYVFRLLDSPSDRNIVQIFDKNERHLITTILALPNYRLEPTGKTVFNFWETPAGQPPAVRAWFYPGDNYGQEFIYPKGWSAQTASTATAAVAAPAPQAEPAPVETAPQEQAAVTPAPAPEPPAAAAEPEPQQPPPATEQTPAPAPQETPAPSELPHTASSLPLIGLAGLISLAGFVALRRATSR